MGLSRRAFVLAIPFLAGCAGDDPPPPPTVLSQPNPPTPGLVRLTGTGALGPLAERLAEGFSEQKSALTVVVESTVGSEGGVRATFDGAIDLGLLSRPLTEAEARGVLKTLPIARSAVVIAANAKVQASGITRAELLALYGGTSRAFASGEPAALLLRDGGESQNAALERVVPELAALRAESYRTRRVRVLFREASMRDAIVATPHGIGVLDLSSAVLGPDRVSILALDGVTPSLALVENGTWRATRDLAFAVRPERLPHVEPFLAFIRSPAGAAIIRAMQCMPLAAEALP